MIGDDLIATRAVALGVARAQAMRRRVFLASLNDEAHEGDDGRLGVSDMIRYGVSLARAAVPSPDSPNLFRISAGAESALSEDVLESPAWRVFSEQVHRAEALLLVVCPTHTPGLPALATRLDGVLVVGESEVPAGARVLGEVHTAATMRTPSVGARAATGEPRGGRAKWLIGALVGAVALLAIPTVRAPLMQRLGLSAPAQAPTAPPATSLDVPAIPSRATSDAAWSAEVRFFNTREDAQALVTTLGDTMPAATFAPRLVPGDSASWYRVVVGAFSDSISAENFLSSLRSRGAIPASDGRVTHTPWALLVDSASDNVMARLRISGYQGRGLPAYSLRDSSNLWRVYVGAFGEAADANRFKQELDSLNIQSTLVVRVGSTS